MGTHVAVARYGHNYNESQLIEGTLFALQSFQLDFLCKSKMNKEDQRGFLDVLCGSNETPKVKMTSVANTNDLNALPPITKLAWKNENERKHYENLLANLKQQKRDRIKIERESLNLPTNNKK